MVTLKKKKRGEKLTRDRGSSGLKDRDEKLIKQNGQGDQVDKGVGEIKDRDK